MTNTEKRRKRKASRKEPGKPPVKQPKYRQLFIKKLAPELQLAVLSHLPIKQMQKCRAINRYMRDLIDNEKNQIICAQGSVARAHERFTKFSKTHVDYDVDAVDEDGNPCGFLFEDIQTSLEGDMDLEREAALADQPAWISVSSKQALRGQTLEDLQDGYGDDDLPSITTEVSNAFDVEFDFDDVDEVGPALLKQLNLPVVPTGLPIGYFARSPRVVSMVKAALSGRKKLTLIERAYVLEGTYPW